MKRPLFAHVFILITFVLNSFGPVPLAQAQELHLPMPGVMVHLSPPANPPLLKGVTVYPNNPFKFDFILDKGDPSSGVIASEAKQSQEERLKVESTKLVTYFLASITTPENDLWVNLSPYEKNRIIPQSFGQTDMGRDLLGEDYILKQITASLIYPEDEIGKKFWKRIYAEAQKKFGTTNIPVNTFNKVWIVPAHAKVYEHGNTAFVVNAKLKVMLEEDYLALSKNTPTGGHVAEGDLSPSPLINTLGSQIVREIVIPELEKEVNEGKNFATLRQVYYSLILAVWFKKRMKDSVLGRKYMDQNKIANLSSPNDSVGDPDTIYQRYLKAFKKGVYNYIKEEPDPMTQEMMPRKYFSGGFQGRFAMNSIDYAVKITPDEARTDGDAAMVSVDLGSQPIERRSFVKALAFAFAGLGLSQNGHHVMSRDEINILGAPHNVDAYDRLVEATLSPRNNEAEEGPIAFYEKQLKLLLTNKDSILPSEREISDVIMRKKNEIDVIPVELSPDELNQERQHLIKFRERFRNIWNEMHIANVKGLLDAFTLQIFGPVLYLEFKRELGSIDVVGVDSEDKKIKADEKSKIFNGILDESVKGMSEMKKHHVEMEIVRWFKPARVLALRPMTRQEINQLVNHLALLFLGKSKSNLRKLVQDLIKAQMDYQQIAIFERNDFISNNLIGLKGKRVLLLIGTVHADGLEKIMKNKGWIVQVDKFGNSDQAMSILLMRTLNQAMMVEQVLADTNTWANGNFVFEDEKGVSYPVEFRSISNVKNPNEISFQAPQVGENSPRFIFTIPNEFFIYDEILMRERRLMQVIRQNIVKITHKKSDYNEKENGTFLENLFQRIKELVFEKEYQAILNIGSIKKPLELRRVVGEMNEVKALDIYHRIAQNEYGGKFANEAVEGLLFQTFQQTKKWQDLFSNKISAIVMALGFQSYSSSSVDALKTKLEELVALHYLQENIVSYDEFFPYANKSVLKLQYFQYYQQIRKTINPDDKPWVVLSGGAGATFTDALAATGGTEIYMADRYNFPDLPLTVNALKEFLKQNWVLQDELKISERERRRSGKYNRGYDRLFEGARTAEHLWEGLIIELQSLGLSLNDIDVNKNKEGVFIRFKKMIGKKEKTITLHFIHVQDLTDPKTYPDALKSLKYDCYFQNAGFDMPMHYANFVSFLSQGLKNNGYWVTDDYVADQDRPGPYDLYPQLSHHFLIERIMPLSESWRSWVLGRLSGGSGYGIIKSLLKKINNINPAMNAAVLAKDYIKIHDIIKRQGGKFTGEQNKARVLKVPVAEKELYNMVHSRIEGKMIGHVFQRQYAFVGEDGDQIQSYTQKIEKMMDDSFAISQPATKQVLDIMAHLGRLWRKIYNNSISLEKRKEALAEYEWWFYQASPEGIELQDTYKQDDQALTMTLQDYVARRVPEFVSEKQASPAQLSAAQPRNARDPGGIDLTAKRMDLEIEKDKSMVSQPMDVRMLENVEINGLYIKNIMVKPLKDLPQLLGVSTS